MNPDALCEPLFNYHHLVPVDPDRALEESSVELTSRLSGEGKECSGFAGQNCPVVFLNVLFFVVFPGLLGE